MPGVTALTPSLPPKSAGRPSNLNSNLFRFLHGAVGYRRVAAKLDEEGIVRSVGMGAALMRETGIAAIQPRAYKRATVPVDQAQVLRSGKHSKRETPEGGHAGDDSSTS